MPSQGKPIPVGSPGPLVLASASPRRQQLLAHLGLSFHVAPVAVDEASLLRSAPAGPDLAEALARAKAEAAAVSPAAVVIAADTLVIVDGLALGKPRDSDEAVAMLRSLRGREHEVITGIAVRLVGSRKVRCRHAASTVVMRAYSEEELLAYVASGDPLDKAGAYAIQHPGFRPVARWEGCYWNIVGLPLCVVSRELAALGVPGVTPALPAGPGRCTFCAPEGPCPAPLGGT